MLLTTEYRCSSAKTVVSGGGGMLWACNLNTATLLLLNGNLALTVDALKMTVQQCLASESLSAQLTLVLTGITGIILIRRGGGGGGGGGGVQPGPMVNQRGVLGEPPAAVLTAVRPLAAVNAPVLREDVRVGEGARTICTLVRPLAGVRVAVILQALAGDEGLRAAVAGEQRAGVQAAVVLQIGRGVEAFAAVVTQVVLLLLLGLAAAVALAAAVVVVAAIWSRDHFKGRTITSSSSSCTSCTSCVHWLVALIGHGIFFFFSSFC